MKATDTPALKVHDLSISFTMESGAYRHAVKRVSLRVGRGEIVGLMGPSGGGKTTLILGLLGLLHGFPGVWEGEAFLDGKPLLPSGTYATKKSGGKIRKRESLFQKAQETLLRNVRGRDVAVIFQEPRAALDPYFSIGEHLLEALRRAEIPGMSGASDRALTKEVLQSQGIGFLQDAGLENAAELWNVYPHELSGGMAQRVVIAMALCAKPKLLVADEPATALDVTTQAKLLELFRRLSEKHGLSVLVISHDPAVIRAVCKRVYVLNKGVLNEGVSVETAGLFPVLAAKAHSPASLTEPGASSPSFFEVKNLHKHFRRNGKSFLALDGVSLRLCEGETYALVGESGSGKSTLALSMLALQGVDEGAVLYKGEDLLQMGAARLRTLRREIRLLFQHPEAVLNGGMTVFALLAEGLEKDGKLSRGEIRERVMKVLAQVHLSGESARRYPHHLSSGEKQRVAIARALITGPKLLICDEPVASLDLAVQARILELLRELQEKMGLTYFFISHNLEWVNQMAQRVGVMYQGKIVEELPVEDFNLEKAQHPYTRLLLSSSLSG